MVTRTCAASDFPPSSEKAVTPYAYVSWGSTDSSTKRSPTILVSSTIPLRSMMYPSTDPSVEASQVSSTRVKVALASSPVTEGGGGCGGGGGLSVMKCAITAKAPIE